MGPRAWAVTRIVPTLLLLASLASADDAVRLMGYERLDASGRPTGVVVALPRAQFDDLWSRTNGTTKPETPPIDMAIGAPSFVVSLAGTIVEGRLEVPVAVLGSEWRDLRLPLPGAIQSIELRPLGGSGSPQPRRMAWRSEGEQLVVNLEGGQQALLVVQFTRKTEDQAGARRVSLPIAPELGGQINLVAAAPWRAVADGLILVGDRADLPRTGGSIDVGWTQPVGAAPIDGRLSAEQQVSLRLDAGRVVWTNTLALASAGAPLSSARLMLPAGLVLGALAGDGVAGWRQEGAQVVVTFAEPAASRLIQLSGSIARSGGAGRAAVTVTVVGAAVHRGRIGLAPAEGERFLRPEHAALVSAQPVDGEALAVRWDDQPEGLTIAWESQATELTLARDLALVVGEGRARVVAALTVAGRGSLENLRLALPSPWRVAGVDGAVSWAVTGQGAARVLVLSAAAPWRVGARIAVRLEVDRSDFDHSPVIPNLAPQGTGIVGERIRLAVADAGATRVRLEAGDARPLQPEVLVQELSRSGGVTLLPGERWRSAAELAGRAEPTLRLTTDAAVATATLSHYLILGRDGVRWSLHIDLMPEQGTLDHVSMRLPPGARLVSVSGIGLGRWQVTDGVLRIDLAAATAAAAAVDLELDLPVAADGAVRIRAPQIEGLRAVQQIALVEEDDLGLIQRESDGLGELENPLARLPDGVERKQVRHLWKAARDDWSLGLTREPLAATTGADGIATLVDGAVSVAPDGELRGTATWHVVNRTRQQLPLRISDAVELWEARVDGHPVRVRRDANGSVWLPVPTLRPGQASTRIGLVWRSRSGTAGTIRLDPPVIGELKIITSVWRVAAPDGWTLTRAGGSLRDVDPADAAADRAQAVIDEIKHLQAVDGLNEAGLKRLEGQLAVLDSELKDHLESIGRSSAGLQGVVEASSAWSSKLRKTTVDINDNSVRLNDMQQQIKGAYGQRADRRRQLNIDQLGNKWQQEDARHQTVVVEPARATALDEPARHLPQTVPWDEALRPITGKGLGLGQAPPGLAQATGAALTGIELVGEPVGPVLILRGQGAALDGEITMTPPQRPMMPVFGAILSGVLLLAGWLIAVRRRGQ